MKLTTSEESRILDEMLKSKSKTYLQLEQLLKSNSVADRAYCRGFAKELQALSMLYEKSKTAVRSNKKYSQLRKDLARVLPKRTSKQQFLANAKAKAVEGEIVPLFTAGKKLNSTEALQVYTATNQHSGKALSRWEIQRTFATQESDLMTLARRYCSSIGLKV
jgi:hypothetical protein